MVGFISIINITFYDVSNVIDKKTDTILFIVSVAIECSNATGPLEMS